MRGGGGDRVGMKGIKREVGSLGSRPFEFFEPCRGMESLGWEASGDQGLEMTGRGMF